MAAATTVQDLEVRRLTGSLGVELRGFALATAGAAGAAQIRARMRSSFFQTRISVPTSAVSRLDRQLKSHPNRDRLDG